MEKYLRRFGLLRLLILSLLAHSPSALSVDRTLFCYVDWAPYTETRDGVVQGITISIVKEAAKVLGREVEFVQRSWNECLEKVEQGEFDAILDAAEREAYLQGPTTFNSYIDTFWVTNESGINRYEQLRASKVSLVEGYVYDDRLMAQLEELGAEVLRGEDDGTIVRDLAKGRYEAAVADLASTFFLAQKENLKIHPILPPFSEEMLYTSFYTGKPELQREFDRAFAQLLESGFVDEVYQQYIGTTFSSFSNRD